MKIVFFGTSPFAAHILKDLINKKYNIVAVVTRPDRPQGRSLKLTPPPVKSVLLDSESSVDVHQPERASTVEFAQILSNYNADLFLVVAYGEIIKDFILKIPGKGCINIHASLLPRYRGAAPIQRSIMDGAEETGITIIEMVSKMDAGPMLVQKKVSVLDSDNAGDVLEKLLSLCENMVPDVLDHFDDYYANRQSQNENEVTYASKIQAQDLVIDWNRSAQEIHNQIRALSPSPCAYCLMNQEGQVKRLKILNSKVLLNSSLKPGQIQVKENTFQVGCQEGVLSLQVVQLEGKKIMPIKDFVLGLASSKEFSILR